jgi:hypothetical protein
MLKLFDDKERNNMEYAKNHHNTYIFYDESGLREMAGVRNILNEWFDSYPSSEQIELKRRFKTEFDSAFYELFLYELFLTQGFKLRVHPTLPDTTKRPDFLVSKGDFEFYLEAKVATDISNEEQSIKNKRNTVIDELNKTNSPNFWLMPEEIIFKSSRQPSLKKAIKDIEKQLKIFDVDEVTRAFESSNYLVLPKIMYEDIDLKIIFFIAPKSPNKRNELNVRPIASEPIFSFVGGSEESIKSAIKEKVSRYGNVNKPYIIAINSLSLRGTDNHDVYNALFGYGNLPIDQSMNKKAIKENDGMFIGFNGWKNTRISAVLITKVLTHNLNNAEHWLVKHPMAKNEIDLEKLDLSLFTLDEDRTIDNVKNQIKDIFSVTDDYLNL